MRAVVTRIFDYSLGGIVAEGSASFFDLEAPTWSASGYAPASVPAPVDD